MGCRSSSPAGAMFNSGIPPPREVVASEVTSLSLGFGVIPRPRLRACAFGYPGYPTQPVAGRLARLGGGGSETNGSSERDEPPDPLPPLSTVGPKASCRSRRPRAERGSLAGGAGASKSRSAPRCRYSTPASRCSPPIESFRSKRHPRPNLASRQVPELQPVPFPTPRQKEVAQQPRIMTVFCVPHRRALIFPPPKRREPGFRRPAGPRRRGAPPPVTAPSPICPFSPLEEPRQSRLIDRLPPRNHPCLTLQPLGVIPQVSPPSPRPL